MKTWIAKLQANYASESERTSYAETYGLASRIGYQTPAAAWRDNPLIGGSTEPGDFGLVTLDEFTRGYIQCALWSSNDESTPAGGVPLDQNYSIADLAPGTLAQIVKDCAQFQADNSELLAEVKYPRNDSTELAHAGHVFWLTRCGHGAGFWDGDLPEELGQALTNAAKPFGNVDLYVGDDGKIYCCP